MTKNIVRCDWCGDIEEYVAYHDSEWGVPLHNDNNLFELLTLEGAQAGLSWLTILRKREGYREAFKGFNPKTVVKFNDKDIKQLNNNPSIVRNKLKILSVIKNANVIIDLQKEFNSLDNYLWQFVNNKTIQNNITDIKDLPSVNDVAISMSKDLKNRGMNFVGPTICYSFMQSAGLVNDHLKSCFRYKELAGS